MYEHPGVVPTLNGQPFIEKPPLYYWTTSASFRLAGGKSVAAARAVSALAAVLTLVVAFVWVARALAFDTAAFATVLLGTFAAFITSAHWVRIDGLLLLFCTIAIWAAWERIGRAGGAKFLAIFYAGLVLALWTKGLIGPVLIAAGLMTYAALARNLRVLAPLRPFAGIAVMLAAVASLAAAIAATGGVEALRTWFFVNHVERFVHPVATGHQRPFAYYVWTLPTAIAPWLVSFVALFYVRGPLWKRVRPDAAILRFALSMVAGPLVVLSLSSSKREVYLVPLLPPLALLMASAVRDRIDAGERSATPSSWTRAGDWVQAAILGLAGIAPEVAYVAFTKQVTPAAVALGVLGLASAIALVSAVAHNSARRAFWVGAASLGLAIAGAFALVVPQVDAIKDLSPFVSSIDGMLPRGEPVTALGADETLLGIVSFVTGRRVIPIEPTQLAEAQFVLVQSVDKEPVPAALEADYERVAMREFGPSRRMALWRRRTQATVTSLAR